MGFFRSLWNKGKRLVGNIANKGKRTVNHAFNWVKKGLHKAQNTVNDIKGFARKVRNAPVIGKILNEAVHDVPVLSNINDAFNRGSSGLDKITNYVDSTHDKFNKIVPSAANSPLG